MIAKPLSTIGLVSCILAATFVVFFPFEKYIGDAAKVKIIRKYGFLAVMIVQAVIIYLR